MKPPNPGSDDAKEAGCTCPRMDNSRGRGFMGNPDLFAVTEDCPLHWEEVSRKDADD